MTARACEHCLRRSWLLARLAGRIEIAWRRERPVRDVLSLADEVLIEAIAGPAAARVASEHRDLAASALLEQASAAGLRTLCRHLDAYPARLRDDSSAPGALFVAGRGSLTALVGDGQATPPAIAIVGTRRASIEGNAIARGLGRGLSSAGVTVVSGMALGIDSAAHEGAVDGGGATVAILAGGADVPYPRSKSRVYERILAGGCVVSEMPPGFAARRWCFPARNRIIAALASATIVVEGAQRSGSLITVDFATQLGRDVGAVPGSTLSWRSSGPNHLLRDGATVVRDAADALDLALGMDGAALAARRAAVGAVPADLDDSLRTLLDAVEGGRDTLPALGCTPDETRAAMIGLGELEALGLVRRAAGGRYVRTAS